MAALYADLLHHVVGVSQACGVDDVHGHAINGNHFAHGVARGACDVGDNRNVVARQSIEQTGFAHIGRAHQHHLHAFTQYRALLRLRHHAIELGADVLQFAFGIGGFEKINVFFGEIERGFYQHAQGNHIVYQGVDVVGKRAFERAQRHASRRLAGGINQIGHAFGLGQIEFVVQKSALGEFAWLGHACAQFQAAAEQHLHHHRAAVALQFNHVFACEAGGRGKIQQQAIVDRAAIGGQKIAVQSQARLRGFTARDGGSQWQQILPRQTNHTHAPSTRSGGNGGYGDGFRHLWYPK